MNNHRKEISQLPVLHYHQPDVSSVSSAHFLLHIPTKKKHTLRSGMRGVTLVEMIIYTIILALIFTVIYRILIENRRQLESPSAAFRLQQDIAILEPIIRRDLEETALDSICLFPGESSPSDTPGLTLLSFRDKDDSSASTPQSALSAKKFDSHVLTSRGTPYWQKAICYTIQADDEDKKKGVGKLVRFEVSSPGFPATRPFLFTTDPSSLLANHSSDNPDKELKPRILARNILLPDQELDIMKKKLGKRGGFDISFMDAEGNQDAEDRQLHPIVSVNLYCRDISPNTGKESVIHFTIQVLPRF